MANAKTHEENRDVLIVVIRSAMRCAVRAGFTRRAAVHEPVGFGNNEQVTTAARKIAVGNRGLNWTLGRGTILHLLGAKNRSDTGLRVRHRSRHASPYRFALISRRPPEQSTLRRWQFARLLALEN